LKNLPFFPALDTVKRHQSGAKFSRKHLVEIDRNSLIKTFEQAIADVRMFIGKKNRGN